MHELKTSASGLHYLLEDSTNRTENKKQFIQWTKDPQRVENFTYYNSADNGLALGDFVIWENCNGLIFGNYVIGFDQNGKIYLDTDSYWAPMSQDEKILEVQKITYTEKDWERDGDLKIYPGNLVAPEIIYELAGAVPPIMWGRRVLQCGEPYSCDENYVNLYHTFLKNDAGQWVFIGNAYSEETTPTKSISEY